MYADNVIHLAYVRDIMTLCRVIDGSTASRVIHLTPQGLVDKSRGFLIGMGISFRLRTSHSSSTVRYVVVLVVGFIVLLCKSLQKGYARDIKDALEIAH